MKDSTCEKKPAIVRYIGESNERFTTWNLYEAFFLEYWQGERHKLHARGNDGEISDYNHFEDFEVISDEDNVLNTFEAIVRCTTHKHESLGLVGGLTYGEEYKAIGCDKDGLYLVMDNSWDCFFYPPDSFEIVQDEHALLSQRSIYYSYGP